MDASPSHREDRHHALVHAYNIDIAARASLAIEIAQRHEAARRPDPDLKVTVKPIGNRRVAVDFNGVPLAR